MKPISDYLLENSKSAIIACLEIHNKPIFTYRYEICSILCINGWELILKTYLNENSPEFKLINKDSTTKHFLDCLEYVSRKLGNSFMHVEENLKKLYDFRCHAIHFYKENIDVVLYSILHKAILNYNKFIKSYFNVDLTEEIHLMLLPIGFTPFMSPVDFLKTDSTLSTTSSSVQTFIKSIVESAYKLKEAGIEDTIFSTYRVTAINENRITNADIIAGITKDPDAAKLSINTISGSVNITAEDSAKKIRIEEESLFKTIYTLKHSDIVSRAREIYSDFKQNPSFNRIMKEIKNNPSVCRKRYLDVINQQGTGQEFYSTKVFTELNKHYTLRELNTDKTEIV